METTAEKLSWTNQQQQSFCTDDVDKFWSICIYYQWGMWLWYTCCHGVCIIYLGVDIIYSFICMKAFFGMVFSDK